MASALAMQAGRARPSFWRWASVWTKALRPFSVPLSGVPVLLGTLLAAYDGSFALGLFLLTLLSTVAIHAGANLANNYYDYIHGLDSSESFGPARLIGEGLVSPQAMRNAMRLAFVVGILSGLVIVLRVGWPILAVGLLSVGVAYLYSAGPKPLAYLGLGEVLVFTFLGVVILEGSYYVQMGELSTVGLWLAAALGLWATSILVLNDIRDCENDERNGKLTVAALVGRRWSEREFGALTLGSYALLITGVSVGMLPAPTLVAAVMLPWTARLVRNVVSGGEGRAITRLQGATTLNYAAFSVLLAAGIALGGRS